MGPLELDDGKTAPEKWTNQMVLEWAARESLSSTISDCLALELIDGQILLNLTEDDIRSFRSRSNYGMRFGDMKKLWIAVRKLQECQITSIENLSESCSHNGSPLHPALRNRLAPSSHNPQTCSNCFCATVVTGNAENQPPPIFNSSLDTNHYSPPLSVDGRATTIPPEFFKTAISLGYSFLVTWITSFVMVIVHERVPDMKRYPPLPDIFLDNVPHIPWAFNMCEITGTLLFCIWSCVCVFHKWRMVLLRRFFALAGTVFLLRCVTMLITSLSVPGTHLQCNQNDYAVVDADLPTAEAIQLRISRAYIIWSGLGMSIQGVRTCGDYMFSGHTVALTLLNFFITEYTPRNLYFLHTLSWLLNMFGIFFILAAHEHYSIDVFVAFYITSRLFLYYHTLANNQALMSRDSNRTRIWFPMFSYFESSVDGIIPNEYESLGALFNKVWQLLMQLKDACMLTAQRYWIDPKQLAFVSNKTPFDPTQTTVSKPGSNERQRLVATATINTATPNTGNSITKATATNAMVSDSAE